MNASIAETSVRVSAADRAYLYVKDGVLARHFPPHELLSEGQIADAVGVSRTPVREALLRLQSEGLLRLLPKRGALVLPVTAEEIADVLETRRLIEGYAARKAVTRLGAGELGEQLDRCLRDMRLAAKAADVAAYVAADQAFHLAIVAATGNEIMTSLYRSLRERQLRMGAVNLVDEGGRAVDPARIRATIRQHEQIRDAIAARSVRAVTEAVTTHLDTAERTLSSRR